MNNNNQICNQKVEVPTGIDLNDKDYITAVLSCLKAMEKNYAVSLTEASCEDLYEKFKATFLKIADLQRKTYELMFSKGWYCMEKVEEEKLTSKYDTLFKDYQDLEI